MPDSPRPLGPMILTIVGVLVALAVFWVGFMLAPAAVLLISYLALSAGERGRHKQQPESSPAELTAGPAGQAGVVFGGRMGTGTRADESDLEAESGRTGPRGPRVGVSS